MSRKNALSDKHERLKHYAAMAARMDERMDRLIGRGAFTLLTLDQLSLDPLGKMDTDRPSDQQGDSPAPSHKTVQQAYPVFFSAVYSPADKVPSAESLRTASVIRLLSIVYDVLLPLHAMLPLAQKIRKSAVLWYIGNNRSEGIQIHTATFRQVIDIRHNKRHRLNCFRKHTAILPPSRGIALHLRIIFRILKLRPCDGDDDDDDE